MTITKLTMPLSKNCWRTDSHRLELSGQQSEQSRSSFRNRQKHVFPPLRKNNMDPARSYIDWNIEIMMVLCLSFGGGQRLDVFLSRSNAFINRARYRLKTFWPPFDNLCHKDVGRGGVGELAVLSLELCMWMLLVDHGWYRGAKSVGLGVGWKCVNPQLKRTHREALDKMPHGNS